MKTKRTPEELKAMRQANIAKARAAKGTKKMADDYGTSPAMPATRELKEKLSAPSEFLGLTKKDCAIGCNEQSCVITGKPICGHPHKGGIQPIHKIDPGIVSRYNGALMHLEKADFDKRHQ